MLKALKDIAAILAIFVLLFLAANAGAWYYLETRGNSLQSWLNRTEVSPLSRNGLELRRKILGTDDESYLRSLEDQPFLRAHPVLQFTSGFSTEHYTVGVEGIRYLPEWDDEFVQTVLNGGSAGYVLGGSTTFGHGVPNDSTVVAYLNKLDTTRTWLNFGVNAYDSIRETDKLLHLLRQGYRPGAVLYLDGLNELTTFMASPYRSADKPRTQGFLIDRGKPALLFGTPTAQTMRLAFAYAFPITHLYFYLTEEASNVAYGSLDANKIPVDYRLMSWHYKYNFEYSKNHATELKQQWVEHYQRNIDFVTQLGKTFGFKVIFVYQPNGYMEPENPFMTDNYEMSPRRQLAIDFNTNAKEKIAAGELDMYDCLGVFENFDSAYAFVDATHYSPQGNEKLAECLMTAIDQQSMPAGMQ